MTSKLTSFISLLKIQKQWNEVDYSVLANRKYAKYDQLVFFDDVEIFQNSFIKNGLNHWGAWFLDTGFLTNPSNVSKSYGSSHSSGSNPLEMLTA